MEQSQAQSASGFRHLASGSSEKAATVFDRPTLMARLMGDEALAMGIVASFLGADMPKRIQAIKTSLDQNDARSAGDHAHAINGAAANMGGMALSAIAFEIEKAGKSGRVDAIAGFMPELERQFDRLKKAMEATE